MLDVLTAEDVRRQDAACEARGIRTAVLMEEAGWGVARTARRLLGGTAGRRIAVVCGKGNNGGDGLVAARHLVSMGARATAVLCETSMRGAAAENLEAFSFVGRVVGLDGIERELDRADLAIDAVLGVGLSRAPEGSAAEAIRALRASAVPIVAVDVPSGVDADTGSTPGAAVRAAVTVTLGGLKPGLLFQPGRALAGRVEVRDIGVPADLKGGSARALEGEDVRATLPRRSPGAHKRSAGTVLLVAGSRAMPGAAALVAAGAVRGGAGLTTLAAPEAVCRIAISRVPELTTVPIPESEEGTLDEKAVDAILERAGSCDALVIGPGLSIHPAALEAVRLLLAAAPIPLVADADALTALAAAPEIARGRAACTVLTPHAGELSRLVGRPAGTLDSDRLRAARAAAADLGAIVLFKGPGTVVCDARGEVFVNPTGGEALAQGGTGDVLAGLLGALCAQRARAGGRVDARLVAAGAWIHGAAGDRAAARVGLASAGLLPALIAEVVHEVAP
ncbi:MAG: NAD(P)H-hydrate dehydratase [Acidobacteria bacterium]|nr:NAD(P)H-hydrate dehydratase [Acidobacteriota bacterium]